MVIARHINGNEQHTAELARNNGRNTLCALACGRVDRVGMGLDIGGDEVNVIVRRGNDDFDALMVAQAIESAGAEVFSIVADRRSASNIVWHVFAKHSDDVQCDEIDDSISKMYDRLEAERRLRGNA